MSEDAWEAAQEGAELIADGELEQAVQVLSTLAQAQPKNEYARFYLGAAHYELHDYARALQAYVGALQVAPTHRGAMIGAGHALRMLGRNDQAIRMGQQLLVGDKQDQDALYLLGSAHFAHGDNHAAEQFLRRFLDTNPEVEAATEAEGMLQVIAGQIVPAREEDEQD
jgi:cytochrome c-type biogenesis protein CcmH/NrfG